MGGSWGRGMSLLRFSGVTGRRSRSWVKGIGGAAKMEGSSALGGFTHYGAGGRKGAAAGGGIEGAEAQSRLLDAGKREGA